MRPCRHLGTSYTVADRVAIKSYFMFHRPQSTAVLLFCKTVKTGKCNFDLLQSKLQRSDTNKIVRNHFWTRSSEKVIFHIRTS